MIRLIQYSQQTVAAYSAVMESLLDFAHPERREESIKYLAQMVHCDIAGELREPQRRPRWWPDHLAAFADGSSE